MKKDNFSRPPLKIALMGLGRAMLNEHFPVFASHPTLFNVVAACDLIKERRDIVAKVFPKCKMFRVFDDMLDEHDIDLVIIGLPAVERKDYVLSSIKRGFWTLIESPIALSTEEAQLIRGAAIKSNNRVAVIERSLFEPDFMLTKQMMSDNRLGLLHKIVIREEEYIKRNDWQAVKRTGGGAAFCQMPNLLMKALKLIPTPPIQMWSDSKRITSLGDVEDYVHVNLITRSSITADIEYNPGVLQENRGNSFELHGTNGSFCIQPGQTKGIIRYIDPSFKFPYTRSSVRTPPITVTETQIPVCSEEISLPQGTHYGRSAFWKSIYEAVRIAKPLSYNLSDSIKIIKYVQLIRKSSPYGR
jgi:predicted dehydrogenase